MSHNMTSTTKSSPFQSVFCASELGQSGAAIMNDIASFLDGVSVANLSQIDSNVKKILDIRLPSSLNLQKMQPSARERAFQRHVDAVIKKNGEDDVAQVLEECGLTSNDDPASSYLKNKIIRAAKERGHLKGAIRMANVDPFLSTSQKKQLVEALSVRLEDSKRAVEEAARPMLEVKATMNILRGLDTPSVIEVEAMMDILRDLDKPSVI